MHRLYLAVDPDIRTIVAYAEGVRDGAELTRSPCLSRAAWKKPVVFMKVGQSAIGAQAAASHTAALAGSDAVYDSVLQAVRRLPRRRYRRDYSTSPMPASRGVLPKGRRIGFLTVSGGVGIQMADAAVAARTGRGTHARRGRASTHESAGATLRGDPQSRRLPRRRCSTSPELIDAYLDIMLESGGYDAIVAYPDLHRRRRVHGRAPVSPRYREGPCKVSRSAASLLVIVAPDDDHPTLRRCRLPGIRRSYPRGARGCRVASDSAGHSTIPPAPASDNKRCRSPGALPEGPD